MRRKKLSRVIHNRFGVINGVVLEEDHSEVTKEMWETKIDCPVKSMHDVPGCVHEIIRNFEKYMGYEKDLI